MTTEITPPGPEAPEPVADQVTISAAELKVFEDARARLVAIEGERQQTQTALESLTATSAADLAAANARAEQMAERSRNYAIDSAMAHAFAGHDLVEGSMEDLCKLWRDDIEAEADGDRWKVKTKDGRSVSALVAERLAGRHSNHVKATSRSGASGGGGNVPAPTQGNPNDGPQPMSVSERLIVRERDHLANAKPTRGLAYRP